MNTRHSARWVGPILCVALLAGCTPGGGEKTPEASGTPSVSGSSATPTGPAAAAPKVVVATIGRRDINVAKDFTATTVASRTVEVRSRVTGTLLDFGFREGSVVSAGQLLFQIDPAQFQADVLQAQAQVARARADLQQALNQVSVKKALADVAQARATLAQTQLDVDRYSPLAKTQVIPQQTLDTAVTNRNVAKAQLDASLAQLENTRINSKANIDVSRANLQAAEAQVTSAQIKLGYCTVTSTVTGIIGKLQVDPGNIVGPGDKNPMVTVSQLDPMYAEFYISEIEYLGLNKRLADEQAGRIRATGKTPFELLMADGTIYPRRGRFVMAGREVDAKTGTLLIRVAYSNPAGLLKPGQFARIKVAAQQTKGAVLVPQKAVTEMQSMQAVMVVGPDKKVESRTIVTEGDFGEFFIVKEGLKGGEMVIVDGIQKVRPGQICDPSDAPAVVQ